MFILVLGGELEDSWNTLQPPDPLALREEYFEKNSIYLSNTR